MPSRYRRVSYEQRCQIFALIGTKNSIREISKHLNLHRSTIYRELSRNRGAGKVYDSKTAQELSTKRRKSCAREPKLACAEKFQVLTKALADDLSPEQIAGRFKICSHQTIYRSIREYFPELQTYLRRYGRRRGRGRAGRRPKREIPSWYKPISLRPRSVDLRDEIGHWERDTMYVKDRKQLLIAVERKTRFVRIAKLHQPLFVNAATETLKLLRVNNRTAKTITNDRGAEFRGETKIKTPIYFCDPHSPQQRGTIENTIGLLRQYLTLKTDFDTLSTEDLKRIERKLNHRPRKCLNYRTPHEEMFDLPVALAI